MTGDNFFDMDNILTGDEVASLFADSSEEVAKDNQESQPEQKKEDEIKTGITEVGTAEELFGVQPESVGDEEKGEEDTASTDSNSPENSNFYSSITDALVDDGVFPDLPLEKVKNIQTPEDFRNLIEEVIRQGLEERQRRIDDALSAGINTDVIKQYEGTLNYLDSITVDAITDESQQGEDLRKRIILQDLMNKNFSQENALKMVKMFIDSGEDIEQAKQALMENKKFFSSKYQLILDNAKLEVAEVKRRQNLQIEQLKKDMLSSDKLFGQVEIDKSLRQKAYDNVIKPVYKDSKTGEYYTALQKYKLENENEFIKNVGLIFTLTDGFKDLSKLVNPSAKKEVKKKMRELENTLKNTARDTTGNPKYVGISSNETVGKSIFDRGFTIDL